MSDHEDLSVILRVFRDGETFERMAAESALKSTGEAAIPGLLDSLDHENGAVRASAVRLLGEIPLSDSTLIPRLVGMLTAALADSTIIVRWYAADSLRRIARAHAGSADDAVEALIPLLEDDSSPHVSVNQTVSEQAAAALRAIRTEQAIEAVEAWWDAQGGDDW